MNINSYLRQIAASLIVKDEEKDKINNSINIFINRIKTYFKTFEHFSIKEVSVFGSFSRNTNLPRRVDADSDADIMVVFEDDYSTPQTYLNRIKRAVEHYYPTSDIKQSSPTIVLDMTHIKFEITPAINRYGQLYIKKNDSWIITNALEDYSFLELSNKNNTYDIKPLIRLVKYWNVSKNKKYCASYEIENKIVQYFLSGSMSSYDFKNKLYYAFKAIECLDSIDAPKAANKVKEAINDESIYPYYSESEIKDVIGDIT